MGYTLMLEVPEDIYEPLVQTAKRTGRPPEELAVEWLVAAVRDAMNDPIENFIGAFSSNTPDWADQHDKYIGQTLMGQICSKEDEGN